MQSLVPIGQEKAWGHFIHSVQENRLSHALILNGVPGVGKFAFANAMAAYLNCDNPSENQPCGICPSCQKISKGLHPDVHYIFPIISRIQSGKSLTSDDFIQDFRKLFLENPYLSLNKWASVLEGENKQLGIFIHDIRELKRKLNLKAFEQKYKVVIIWYAEKINVEGANAFLKLLEEPTEKTLLLLCVSDTSALLPTIRSRCQSLYLQKLSPNDIKNYLETHFELDSQHAQELAFLADGSLSKAIDMANESHSSFSELYIEWMRCCYEGSIEKIHNIIEKISKNSRENQKLFLDFALQKLRDSLFFQTGLEELSSATEVDRDFLRKFSKFLQTKGIESIVHEINQAYYYISRNANAQLVFMGISLKINAILRGTLRHLQLQR
ncbi:MAG: DNA polymerase III subunit delta [Bacteroidia bacterium]|nr:MAG: DNA polymerase III subunit delta [Bacteroidia bacterium]